MDEALEAFLEALRDADDGKTCFIVEGKNDVAALKEQGIKNVFEMNTQPYLFCEKIAQKWKRVVLLTDLDAEGKRLYGRLKGYFSRLGVFVVEGPREALWKTNLRQLEGLPSYLKDVL